MAAGVACGPRKKLRKIPGAHFVVRHSNNRWTRRQKVADSLEIGKEERLVFAIITGQKDRPPDDPAKLAANADALGVPQLVVLPGVRIQGRVAQVVVSGAVKLVRSALGDDVDDAAHSAAVLGVEGAALDLELLDSVEIW